MRAVPLFYFFLVLSLMRAAASAQEQTPTQQKCINTVDQAYEKVAKAERKQIARCIALGGKSQLGTTIEDCVVADEKQKVAKAQQKTLEGGS